MNPDATNLKGLPPPPAGQQGVTFASLQHLPPPPQGQQGMTLDQINGTSTQTTPKKGFLGTNPGDSLYGKIIDNSVTRGIQSIFPGKQIGTAIGNSVDAATGLAKGDMNRFNSSASANNENMALRVGGDIAQAGLTVAAPGVGRGATVGGRILANTALGVGLGESGGISEGKAPKEVGKDALLGGAIGGGVSSAGELSGYLSDNMPRWFTKLALPKLANSKVKGAPDEVVDYAIKNTKGASLKSMYGNSQDAVNSFEGQVQSTLSHPQYAKELGSQTVLNDVVNKFGNAQLTPEQVVSYAKNVAPTEKNLIDKVFKGTANLSEKNQLRKILDMGTKARFTDTPKLSFAKQVSGALADVLRSDVQGTAKETVPIFKEYSKEITLNKALKNALSKKRIAGPLVAGGAGFAHGGIKGALEAVAVEEGLRSPTAKILAAKGIKAVSPVAGTIAKNAFQGLKAPVIKKLTGGGAQ